MISFVTPSKVATRFTMFVSPVVPFMTVDMMLASNLPESPTKVSVWAAPSAVTYRRHSRFVINSGLGRCPFPLGRRTDISLVGEGTLIMIEPMSPPRMINCRACENEIINARNIILSAAMGVFILMYCERLAFYPECRRFLSLFFSSSLFGGILDKTLLNGSRGDTFITHGLYTALPGDVQLGFHAVWCCFRRAMHARPRGTPLHRGSAEVEYADFPERTQTAAVRR